MNTITDIDPKDWQRLETEVRPKIEKLDSSYDHFFNDKNLQAKFLTPGGEEALKNFKDLVGNMKGVLVEIDPNVFPPANRAAIQSKVTDIQNNLTTEKAKVFFGTDTAKNAINALQGKVTTTLREAFPKKK